jgi:pimeloyl-ACP methyl ester carboxylesterase
MNFEYNPNEEESEYESGNMETSLIEEGEQLGNEEEESGESEYESGKMEISLMEEEQESESGEKKESSLYGDLRDSAEDLLERYQFFSEDDILEVLPEKEITDIPVFASPGWGVTPDAWQDSLKIISDEGGRRVVTANYTREEMIDKEGLGADIPTAELQKALAIIDILDSRGLAIVDGIGHSEGGLNLAMAASLFPERFRSLVFVSPAGSINISKEELVKRFAIDEGLEEMKGMDRSRLYHFKDYLKGVVKNFLGNPSLSHKEIEEMTELDIFKMTRWLKDNGIDIGLIAGANDKVFKMDEINELVGEEVVDDYITTKGNHGSLIFEQEYAHLSGNILNNMRIRRESRRNGDND